MRELMDLLIEWLALEDAERAEGVLGTDERARWMALRQLLPGDGAAPRPRASEDDDDGSPVQLTTADAVVPGRLMSVSRDGFRVRTQRPQRVGQRTVVRVLVIRAGVEYAFPCVVAWSDEGAMGLRFDGVAERASLRGAHRVNWNRPLDLRTGWGARPTVASA